LLAVGHGHVGEARVARREGVVKAGRQSLPRDAGLPADPVGGVDNHARDTTHRLKFRWFFRQSLDCRSVRDLFQHTREDGSSGPEFLAP
jgi:hypothetical protein